MKKPLVLICLLILLFFSPIIVKAEEICETRQLMFNYYNKLELQTTPSIIIKTNNKEHNVVLFTHEGAIHYSGAYDICELENDNFTLVVAKDINDTNSYYTHNLNRNFIIENDISIIFINNQYPGQLFFDVEHYTRFLNGVPLKEMKLKNNKILVTIENQEYYNVKLFPSEFIVYDKNFNELAIDTVNNKNGTVEITLSNENDYENVYAVSSNTIKTDMQYIVTLKKSLSFESFLEIIDEKWIFYSALALVVIAILRLIIRIIR